MLCLSSLEDNVLLSSVSQPQILNIQQPQNVSPDLDLIPVQDMDPTSTAVVQILEIIPDVEPTHLSQLIQTHLPIFSVFHEPETDIRGVVEREINLKDQVQGVVGLVLHLLLENPNHPKVDRRAGGQGKWKRVLTYDADVVGGKSKGKSKDISVVTPEIDYTSIDRPFPDSQNYFDLALYHLQISFPRIPKPYISGQLFTHKHLYAPTYLSILAAEESFEEKQTILLYLLHRVALRKPQSDVAFEEEKAWLDAKLAGGDIEKGVEECQCCFAHYPFSNMVQCPDAHLFCPTCISKYASSQLGAHNSSLPCIQSSSPCPLPFSPSELKRILSVTLYDLYERLEQQKQIAEAQLADLEGCPFCEWKCVLEASAEEDKLFRCGNKEGCGAVSCRGCRKLDHLPKGCKEDKEDTYLNGQHRIEETMTRALTRNCPNLTCRKAFIKESGCNKMRCPNCSTLSCYVCRQVITGYEHFKQQTGISTTNECVLWDPIETRQAQEVQTAAEKATEAYKRDHPCESANPPTKCQKWGIQILHLF